MAQWIEVKVRYEKLTETGKSVKVTDPYLVDALSCTEAEARVVEEITPFCNDFNVLNVGKTKISEIFWSEGGDKFYKHNHRRENSGRKKECLLYPRASLQLC